MLGTRQFKPPPIEPITEKSFSEENEASFQPFEPVPVVIEEPVKEVVIEKPKEVVSNKRTEESVTDKPEPIHDDELIIKAVRKNLICSLFPADDSFEANETMLANTSFNDTVLATTLLMSAKKPEDNVLIEKNNEISVTKKKEDETLQQVLDTVSLLLKKNAEAMENNRQEREILMEMKKRISEKIQK